MKQLVFLFLLFSVVAISAGAQTEDAAAHPFRLRADLGFCHWYADELRSSVDLTHLTAGLGFRPGFEFLEIRLRYELAQVETVTGGTAAAFDGDYIHFFSGGLAACQTFDLGFQELTVFAGLNAFVPLLDDAVSLGASLGLGVEYRFRPKPDSDLSFGIFLEVHNQYYELNLPDGSKTDLQCDVSVDLGVVVTLW